MGELSKHAKDRAAKAAKDQTALSEMQQRANHAATELKDDIEEHIAESKIEGVEVSIDPDNAAVILKREGDTLTVSSREVGDAVAAKMVHAPIERRYDVHRRRPGGRAMGLQGAQDAQD